MEPISHIDQDQGILFFRGLKATELAATLRFEDVAFLLVHGRIPSEIESTQFRKRLAELRKIGDQYIGSVLSEIQSHLDSFKADGLEVLETSGLKRLAEKLDTCRNNIGLSAPDTMLLFVSTAPVVVAAEWRIIHGKTRIAPRDSCRHAANFLWMLNETSLNDRDSKDLDSCLILHMDDPDNPSLAALESTYAASGSISKAILAALDKHVGPLHHGAGTEAMRMIIDIEGHPEVSRLLADRLDRGEKLFGLGHRIYRTIDPRAKFLRELLKRRGIVDVRSAKRLASIEEIAELGSKLLLERKGKVVHPNVDLYNAAVYESFEIPYVLNTELFAIARSAGWAAHICEWQ
ncbi:MAG: citrate/2-methylcitrate synthase [Candidatus Thorarchaeota archaeon]|nr:MAG: citrate/2-methylcitrate synthase [Candidatus Thorarchaeota archaeon]